MRLKTFRAFTLDEALDAVRSDLGADAAILHTRTFRRGGFLGIGAQEVVEVIASELDPETTILPAVTREKADENPATAIKEPGSTSFESGPALAVNRARQAYASAGTPGSDPSDTAVTPTEDPPPRSTSLEVDRDRTRALAKAMEIRLERQRAAREAAGVASPDDVIETRNEETAVAPRPAEAAATVKTPAKVQSPLKTAVAEPTSFIIGPGGVLLAEEAAGQAADTQKPTLEEVPSEAPRVISLDPTDTRPAADTGLPVATVSRPASAPVEMPAETPTEIRADMPDRTSVTTVTSDPPRDAVEIPVRTPIPDPPSPGGDSRPEKELESIGATVRRVLDREPGTTGFHPSTEPDDGPDPLTEAYANLIAQEFSRDLAGRVIASLESSLDEAERRDPRVVRRAMLAEIADLVPTEESIEAVVPRDGRPRTIAFVGPTGVGKTTTLAKIAATLTLRDGLKVGMVTADTYRISAVDQLRTYADILEVPLEVAGDSDSMREALARCDGLDAILIDTPGRSQNDTDSLTELRAIMDAARPHETHLVLSGTAAERVLIREAEAFAALGPDRVVLTKLDEAVAFGMLVSVVRRIGRRISWVTTGQEVPSDVERATGTRLAGMVLGGAVKS